MDKVIENYKIAITNHLKAQQDEVIAKDRVMRTRNALLIARDELRSLEQEIMNDSLTLTH